MLRPRDTSLRWWRGAASLLALLVQTPLARATPYDYIPVGDPIEAEFRILDLFSSDSLRGRLRLPRHGTRPLQAIELQGIGAATSSPSPPIAISMARVERLLGRDRGRSFGPHPEYTSTPRLLDYGDELSVFQISAGFQGVGVVNRHDSQFLTGTGLHGRIAMGLDRLIADAHYIAGRFDNARTFADPIIPDNDLILLPEEAYLAYTEELGRWGAQFGRGRWHWGPGEEGSLVLSKTSPALTGLAFRTRIARLRLDAIALSATLRVAAGEQLAAHRLEWQANDRLRIGVTEAARYQSPGWRPLYLVGAIPYVLVQRLEWQSETDSLRALRNNVITACDVAWRVADGTRFYGELLIDDLHARSGRLPNKLGYQVGWESVKALGRGRVNGGAEFTRITRYVYTSFFGRDHAVQGRSLGFPVSPDVRRLRIRAAWDPGPDWQVSARATHSDKGENDLDEPFLREYPRVDSFDFEGVVETTREIELGLRWWPASGVLIEARGAYRTVKNERHIRDLRTSGPEGTLELRLMR